MASFRELCILKDNRITLLAICIFLISCSTFAYANASTWIQSSNGISESNVTVIKVDPKDSLIIYAGTPRAVYRSVDAGKTYQSLGVVKGVNDIYIDPGKLEHVYAAADDGLYERAKGDNSWNRIYSSTDPCLSFAINDSMFYLGTSKGLLTKSFDTSNWIRASGELGTGPVYQIARNNHYVYFVTNNVLYGWDKNARQYVSLFSIGSASGISETDDVSSEGGDVPQEEASQRTIRCVGVSSENDGTDYLATSNGILKSADNGRYWSPLPGDGVPLDVLRSFVVVNNGIWAGTERGVFFFDDGRWTPVYEGMETNEVHSLTAVGAGATNANVLENMIVYAATNRGVFYLSSLQKPVGSREDHVSEPAIRDVQRWAIDYAEVNPQKIKNWRSLARSKAFLPDLSVGLNRADGEFLHWDSGTNPDTLLKGRDLLDWDVSLSWDFSDLVWSTDQTTIDSRSKLMVELREDVLDQVTRVYFERRRLQAELAAGAPELPKRTEKEFRVEELTALLDGFTGGRFSEGK